MSHVIVGFSFKKAFKKAAKFAVNPVAQTKATIKAVRKVANVAKKVAPGQVKALVKLSNPLEHLKIAKDIIKDPLNIKRNVGKLAMLDPGVAAGSAMFRDMKKATAKPKAAAAYKQAMAKAKAGDATAKKVVGTMKQLARADIEAPGQPDSALEPEQAIKTLEPEPIEPGDIEPEPATAEAVEEEMAPESEEASEESEEAPEESPEDAMEGWGDLGLEGWGDLGPRRHPKKAGKKAAKRNKPREDDFVGSVTLLGEDDSSIVVVGFSFGSLLKSVTSAVKAVAPAVMSVAKLTPYGAALDTAMNVVGKVAPGVAQGMGLMEKAKSGDKDAAAKIAQVQALAKAGNPEGQKALETLQQAREIHNAAVIATPAMKPSPDTSTANVPIKGTNLTTGQPVTVNIHLTPTAGQSAGTVDAPHSSWGSLFSAGL